MASSSVDWTCFQFVLIPQSHHRIIPRKPGFSEEEWKEPDQTYSWIKSTELICYPRTHSLVILHDDLNSGRVGGRVAARQAYISTNRMWKEEQMKIFI